jgi:RNA polymerase sigma-70 factor (ECF subfamily)
MTAIEFGFQLSQSYKSLRPFAVKLTKDVEDANDLLQETYLKAFVNKDKFSEGTNLHAWLYTIMKNTFITNYQRMARRKTFIDTTENLHFINSPGYVAQNNAIGGFAQADIQKAMSTLDESHRKPFVMYFTGYKYHEISDMLRLPLGTVKNRIHLARKELKGLLSDYAI